MNSSKTLASTQTPITLGDGYLKFHLNQQTCAVLPIRYSQEVISVSIESVTSMPNVPPWFLGLLNWRNRIIWVIDLSTVINLASPYSKRQYNVIIVRHEADFFGLVVQKIKGTTKLLPDAIQSSSLQVPPDLVRYLNGCTWQDDELLYVLNVQAIVQSSKQLTVSN